MPIFGRWFPKRFGAKACSAPDPGCEYRLAGQKTRRDEKSGSSAREGDLEVDEKDCESRIAALRLLDTAHGCHSHDKVDGGLPPEAKIIVPRVGFREPSRCCAPSPHLASEPAMRIHLMSPKVLTVVLVGCSSADA
jgi:hypothetical protein